MKIYTKTGDAGGTALFGSGRVSKASPRVAAYGEVDELSASIGVAAAHVDDLAVRDALERIQRDLFALGALLATPDPKRRKEKWDLPAARISALEEEIDGWEDELPAITAFVLPGGSQAGASLHAARTVCRRAERAIVALAADDLPDTVIPYVNRLSDWLFVCARLVNRRAGVEERTW
ncbi:MAG TPA: cob(I)yrinic acid a,c-diamide adenosyltransferase [Gemmatimonadota bacterium]|nr:cob(I)yrinic acid a,c-diamide adenosyltransferase [Gemmatimonadota bacterium]